MSTWLWGGEDFLSIVQELRKAEYASDGTLCFFHFGSSLSYTITCGKGGLFVFM